MDRSIMIEGKRMDNTSLVDNDDWLRTTFIGYDRSLFPGSFLQEYPTNFSTSASENPEEGDV